MWTSRMRIMKERESTERIPTMTECSDRLRMPFVKGLRLQADPMNQPPILMETEVNPPVAFRAGLELWRFAWTSSDVRRGRCSNYAASPRIVASAISSAARRILMVAAWLLSVLALFAQVPDHTPRWSGQASPNYGLSSSITEPSGNGSDGALAGNHPVHDENHCYVHYPAASLPLNSHCTIGPKRN